MKNQIFIEMFRMLNILNSDLVLKKISTVEDLKKKYVELRNNLAKVISSDEDLSKNQAEKEKIFKLLVEELERNYHLAYETFKNFNWGEFEKLNKNIYPELWSIMIDKNGDLRRVFDNFPGTVAMMDFHGYTKFSNDIKYNKTPLMEFGETLPAKIKDICKRCRSFVYEIEGDSLIIIGPENPYFVITAVIGITEIAKQMPLFKDSNPKGYFDIDLKNPMIKKFEMNAAITTGGETFINKKGSLIGCVISEASRILKIINLKKPKKSGILISDKVYRNMEKFKNEPGYVGVNLDNISNPYLIDVKGMRLKIREFYLDDKKYIKMCDYYMMELYKLLKIKNPSKWYNIIINYTKLVTEVLKNVNVTAVVDKNEYNSEGLVYILEEFLVRWINRPTPDVARQLIDSINRIYDVCDEVRDAISIYYEYINDNFFIIIAKFEKFYSDILDAEKSKNRKLKLLIDEYNSEIDKLKTRYFPRRIFETVLADSHLLDNISEVPYIGKQ